MIHAYSINSLKGCDYYIKKCTCGYEKKIKKSENDMVLKIQNREYCSECGTPLMNNDLNTLTFAPILQSGTLARLRTFNKACFFELEFYKIHFYTKIDFQKKTLKVDKRRHRNSMVKMVFDASQKPEDFIKYYNEDNQEIDEKAFIERLSDDYYYDIDGSHKISNKFTILNGYVTKNMNKQSIVNMIVFLKNQTDFFIQYEQIIKSDIDPYPIRSLIDSTKTSPIEMLGIRPFTFKYIRSQKQGINFNTFKTIKVMEEKIGDQTVNYLQTFGKNPECMKTNYMNTILDLVCEADLSVTKLFKYIYKEVPMKQFIIDTTEIINLLRDSFEMSKQLGLVFNKNSKTLKRYHDELVEEYKTVEDKILAKNFKTKMKTKEYLNYTEKNSKYCIIVPEESQELVKEGKELKHCVGSYIKRVASGKSYIVFLREKETPEQSFTTIEINDCDEIVQIRKKHNAALTELDAKDFLKNWANKNGLSYSK